MTLAYWSPEALNFSLSLVNARSYWTMLASPAARRGGYMDERSIWCMEDRIPGGVDLDREGGKVFRAGGAAARKGEQENYLETA